MRDKGLASACMLHHCYPLYPIWLFGEYMQLSQCGNSRASGKSKERRGKHGNNQQVRDFS
jgi:hypothetical protein